MTFYKDLELNDFITDSKIYMIGWLEKGYDFPIGEVTVDFYEKLKLLLKDPWDPFICAGIMECSLCQFDGSIGKSNIYIPYNKKIYCSSELILHYINCHYYQPPNEFVEAVMNCPEIKSMEYKKALLSNGGRNLVKLGLR